MNATLPTTLTLRSVTQVDRQGVLDVIHAFLNYAFDEPDYEEALLLEDWTREGFQVETDAWVVTTETGQIVGYANIWREHGEIFVNPDYFADGVREYLIELLEAERLKRADAAGLTGPLEIRFWANALTDEEPSLYEERGYTNIRAFWRMRIGLDEAPEAPVVPEGYTIRPFQAGDERTVHAVMMEAFSNHWGSKPSTFDEWYERQQKVNFDPTLWVVAEKDGQMVGAVTAMKFMEDGGFVRSLGVLSAARGTGIGMALLKQSFVNFHQRGKKYVGLGVDAENTTGATRLYERAGMRVVRRFTRFEKFLRNE